MNKKWVFYCPDIGEYFFNLIECEVHDFFEKEDR